MTNGFVLKLKIFGIKQPVLYADMFWDELMATRKDKMFVYTEVSRFPPVQRDLALVLSKEISYNQLKKTITSLNIPQLQSIKLFDVFESEKLGIGKKSMAVNFTFMDKTKTLTDKEIDEMMGKLVEVCKKMLNTEIRR